MPLQPARSFPVLSGHAVPLASGAYSARDDTLACAYADSALALWDVAQGRQLRTFDAAISTQPDESAVATTESSANRRTTDSAAQARSRWYPDPILEVTFSPDGTLLASTNHGRPPDRSALVWETSSGRVRHRVGGFRYWIHAAAFSPDGSLLAIGGDDRVVKLCETATGQERDLCVPPMPYAISSLAFSPDSRYLVLGCDGCLILIWDLPARRVAHRLEGHVEWTNALAFSTQGGWFVSGGEDGAVKVWDVTTGLLIREFAGHVVPGNPWGGIVFSVAVSPDARWAASAGLDGSPKLWDVTTGNEVATLAPPASAGQSFASSPAETTSQGLRSLRDISGSMRFVAFRSHTRQLVGGTDGGAIHLWDLPDHL